MASICCVFLLVLFAPKKGEFGLVESLVKVTEFALKHSNEINFDGLLGFVIAEAQLMQMEHMEILVRRFETVRQKIGVKMPKKPPKMLTFEKHLLRPENWIFGNDFVSNTLRNLGTYKNWTIETITRDKMASYKGVPSDVCLLEILQKNCFISNFCQEMMLSDRVDTGYLLSHKLFYSQIMRLHKCGNCRNLSQNLCSLMLKELRTNENLGFPAQDIALEQIVLCGMEGYTEFLLPKYLSLVQSWQTKSGCYKSQNENITKRTSNLISFGCSDHSTGLGAAALALNFRFYY